MDKVSVGMIIETEGTEELATDKKADPNKSEPEYEILSNTNESNQFRNEDLNVTEEQKFDDLEAVVRIYDEFRAYQKRVNPSIDKVLEDEFEQKMSDMADELKEVLQEKNSPETKSTCIIKVRHKILDLTSSKLADSIADKPLSSLWKNMRKEYNAIVEDLLGVMEQRAPAKEDETVQLKVRLKELSEVNRNLQKEVNKYVFEKGELKRSFETEKRKLTDKIALLERRGKKTLNDLSSNSKKSLNVSARESSVKTPSNIREPRKSVPVSNGIGKSVAQVRATPYPHVEAAEGAGAGYVRAEEEVRREVRGVKDAQRDYGAVHVQLLEQEVRTKEFGA